MWQNPGNHTQCQLAEVKVIPVYSSPALILEFELWTVRSLLLHPAEREDQITHMHRQALPIYCTGHLHTKTSPATVLLCLQFLSPFLLTKLPSSSPVLPSPSACRGHLENNTFWLIRKSLSVDTLGVAEFSGVIKLNLHNHSCHRRPVWREPGSYAMASAPRKMKIAPAATAHAAHMSLKPQALDNKFI